MEELALQQLCQEISNKYFHKEFRHQITYNTRLKSSGGRYILKTGNIELNPKVENILGKEVLFGVIKHELCHYHLHQEGKGYRHQDREFKMLLQQVGGTVLWNVWNLFDMFIHANLVEQLFNV